MKRVTSTDEQQEGLEGRESDNIERAVTDKVTERGDEERRLQGGGFKKNESAVPVADVTADEEPKSLSIEHPPRAWTNRLAGRVANARRARQFQQVDDVDQPL